MIKSIIYECDNDDCRNEFSREVTETDTVITDGHAVVPEAFLCDECVEKEKNKDIYDGGYRWESFIDLAARH